MRWIFQRASETFSQYQEMWDDLNRSRGNHLLLDSKFVGPLIRYFACKKTLLGICKDHKNPGMVLMDKVREGFWQTFQPSQAPLGLILFGNVSGIVEQIEELIRNLPGYALGFSVLHQDPDFTVFRNFNQCQNVEILEYVKTARVTFTGTFEDYWQSRGKDLTDNLARRCRHLARKSIQFQLVIDRQVDHVAERIQEYGRLEESGWKARQGTAVTAHNRQGLFYREVLENFCGQGEGVIYSLLFDGRNVASQLGIERHGTLILLKMAYEEKFKGFSPGFLLQREIFKALFSEEKIKAAEFYGRVRDGWTTKWTDEVRTMYHVNFYRHSWIAPVRRLFKATLGRQETGKRNEPGKLSSEF